MSDRTVQRRMNDAVTLAEKFPATFDAWERGRVSTGHVHTIMEHGLPITDPAARALFETEALLRAEETTPGRLGASLARLAESLQPRTMTERHREARASRGARVSDIGDGMAEFSTIQPAVLAHAMHDRITQQAKAIKKADSTDTRTLDQIRADLIADMLLTTSPRAQAGAGMSDGFGGLGAIRGRSDNSAAGYWSGPRRAGTSTSTSHPRQSISPRTRTHPRSDVPPLSRARGH
jgi:hypothetical protein